MVNFGETLRVSRHVGWADYYLDYEHLKAILLSADNPYEDLHRPHSHPNEIHAAFLSQLYVETEKISFFVWQEVGRLTTELASCRRSGMTAVQQETTIAHNEEEQQGFNVDALQARYKEVAIRVLRLIRFIDLNVTGIRKIIKKHDKRYGGNLSGSYLRVHRHIHYHGTAREEFASGMHDFPAPFDGSNPFIHTTISLGNQLLQPLLHHDTVAALTASLEAGILDARRLQGRLLSSQAITETHELGSDMARGHRTTPNLTLLADSSSVDNNPCHSVTTKSHDDLQSIKKKESAHDDGWMALQYFLWQIYAAQSQLCQTNRFIHMLAAPLMNDEGNGEDTYGDIDLGPRPSKFSNYLNLLSTFLYMTNYYIVAPTSASYADRLGNDSSLASIIIGMTSVAALISTLLYSWWTSYSYKSALIFASVCSIVGNLLYASGLPCHSLSLVMLGRLLNGFGSARSINRRYIADSYARADRTAAAAAFVTATALGMATGPALASILHVSTADSTSVYWQAENAPGWFMMIVWTLFLICLVWKFEDPKRNTGLDEQRRPPANNTADESQPLLEVAAAESGSDGELNPPPPLWRNIPVITTLIIYMVLKMVLEAVLSSEANITASYFGWKGDVMGLHLTILALLILPVNFTIAFLAQKFDDRELILGLLMSMLVGALTILQYQPNREDYSLIQYLMGSAILFVCASALEAPNMALLSKVIPRKWSRGIINVGLLATESGTGGRVVGDVLLAYVGRRCSDNASLINYSFGPFAGVIVATLAATYAVFDHLEPTEE